MADHKHQALKRRNTDADLKAWRPMLRKNPPSAGWLRAIREALGMTTRQAAERLKVSQPRIVKMEQAEVDGSISMNSLREAAKAMNCQLVYALVPVRKIEEIVRHQAETKARRLGERISHTMALEDQDPGARAHKDLQKARAEELLRGPAKRLWDKDR